MQRNRALFALCELADLTVAALQRMPVLRRAALQHDKRRINDRNGPKATLRLVLPASASSAQREFVTLGILPLQRTAGSAGRIAAAGMRVERQLWAGSGQALVKILAMILRNI